MPGYREIVKYIQLFDVSCEKMHMIFIPMAEWLIWHMSPTSYPSHGQILVIYTRWSHLALKWMPYANILLCMSCLLTTEFYWNTCIYCNLLHVNIYCVSHQASVTMIDALFYCTLILVYHDNSNCGPHWIVYIHHVIAYSVHCSITPCVSHTLWFGP